MGFRRYNCGKSFYCQIKDGWFIVEDLNLKYKVYDDRLTTVLDNTIVTSDETILTGIMDYKTAYIIPAHGKNINEYKENLGFIRTIPCSLPALEVELPLAGYITGETIGVYYPVYKDPGDNDWYHIGNQYRSFKREGKATIPPEVMPMNVFKNSAFVRDIFIHIDGDNYVLEHINDIQEPYPVKFMALSQ